MATRFYLTNDTTAPDVTPTSSSAWEHKNTTNAFRKLLTAYDSSALNTTAYDPDSSDHLVDNDAYHRTYVSDPLDAQTVQSQTVRLQMQALENHANNNLYLTMRVFRCNSSGVEQDELLAITRSSNLEIATSLTNRYVSGTTTSRTFAQGDRLCVEIGVGGTPAASGGIQGHNASLRWGGSASSGDLPSDESQTGATYRPWFELATDTLRFQTTPSKGSLSLAGAAVALALAITPAAGTLGLTGGSAILDRGVTASCGSVAFAGVQPDVQQAGVTDIPITPSTGKVILGIRDRVITPSKQTITLSGSGANIGIAVTPSSGSVGLSGKSAALGHGITPSIGSLALAGSDADVDVAGAQDFPITPSTGEVWFGIRERIRQPSQGTVALAGQGAKLDRGITPAKGSLAISGKSAALDVGITPSKGSLSFAGSQPGVDVVGAGDVPITPAQGAVTLSGQASRTDLGIVPSQGSLGLAGSQPTVQGQGQIAPTSGAIALSGSTPVLLKTAVPSQGALSLAGSQPAVAIGIAPATGASSLSGQTTRIDVGIAPSTGAIGLVGQQGTLATAIQVQPTVGAISLVGYQPTLVGAGGVAPSSGAISLTGQQADVRFEFKITPGAGSIAVAGQLANLGGAVQILPTQGALTLSGKQSDVRQDVRIIPSTGAVALAAQQAYLGKYVTPSVGAVTLAGTQVQRQIGVRIEPSSGSLSFAGNAPPIALGIRTAVGAVALAGQQSSIDRTLPKTPAAGTVAIQGIATRIDVGILPATGSLSIATSGIVVDKTTREQPEWKVVVRKAVEHRTYELLPRKRTYEGVRRYRKYEAKKRARVYPERVEDSILKDVVFSAPFDSNDDPLRVTVGSASVTHSRASGATYIDPITGLVKYAAGSSTNKMRFSEDLTNDTYWWKLYGTTVAPDVSLAPDGRMTADKVVPALQYAHQGIEINCGVVGDFYSFYVKAAELYRIAVQTGAGDMLYIDATAGTIWQVDHTNGRYPATGIDSVGNGWHRVWFKTGGDQGTYVMLGAYDVPSGTQGFYLWGMQVESGDCISTYKPTDTRTNKLLYSEQFDVSNGNTVWVKQTGVSVVANAALAPDGTWTADRVYLGSITNQGIYQANIAMRKNTKSIYVRADVAGGQVKITDPNDTKGYTTHTLTTEWHRISLSEDQVGGYAGLWVIRTDTTPDYVYLWGAQLEDGYTVSDYKKTTDTMNPTPTTAAVPRIEANGLLIEGERTNLLEWSNDISTWNKDVAWSRELECVLAPDGQSMAGRFYCDAFGGVNAFYPATVPSSAGWYAGSMWVKGTQGDSIKWYLDNAGRTNYVTVNFTGSWQRFQIAYQNTSGGVYFYCDTDGSAHSIAVWGAQLEVGRFATSLIPTYGAARTRKADIVSIPASVMDNDEGTVAFSYDRLFATFLSGGYVFRSVLAGVFPNVGSVWFHDGTNSAGQGTSAWQVGVPKGIAAAYRTATRNLLPASDHIVTGPKWQSCSGAWTTRTERVGIAPDGSRTADHFAAVGGAPTPQAYGLYWEDGFSYSAKPYTLSVYAKMDTYNFLALDFTNGASMGAVFDLQTGKVTFADSNVTARIEKAGYGFYRCSITRTMSVMNGYPEAYLSETGTANGRVWTAPGGQSVFVWGWQLEEGEVATAYEPSSNSVVTAEGRIPAIGLYDGAWMTADTIYLGSADIWDDVAGHIKRLRIWKRFLTDPELRSIGE